MYDDPFDFARGRLGRLVETTDAEGRKTRHEYDAAGSLVKLKDANNNVTTFAYTYNTSTLVVRKTHADGKYEEYTYDGGGLLMSRTNARGTTATYSYNDFGEPTGIDYSDTTPDVTYTYDSLYGRLTEASSGAGTYHYDEYDGNARVKKETDPWGNTVEYTYDAVRACGLPGDTGKELLKQRHQLVRLG